MNPPTPIDKRTALFFKKLSLLVFIWVFFGILVLTLAGQFHQTEAFFKVFLICLLDLAVLLILMWKTFFVRHTGIFRKIDLLFWFVFKLVCWAFLAITLKRLTNASGLALALGAGFVAAGPILAGYLTQKSDSTEN